MNSEKVRSKRDYSSALRERQAAQTRHRILEAYAEQMVDSGVKDFSIERVAQRAGVSSRTVYHYFPNRDDLLDAVAAWQDEQVSIQAIQEPITVAEFLQHVRKAFETFDSQETFIRAQLITELGREVRGRGRSRRRPAIESMIRSEIPNLKPSELRRATSIIHYLTSSEAWRSMKDESGLSGKEAGQAVTGAISVLLEDLGSDRGNSSKGREGQRR
jgi:AcrR family transcriptional regulator